MERFRSQCVDTMPRDDRSSLEKLVFLLSCSVSVFWFNVGRFPSRWFAYFPMISFDPIGWPSMTMPNAVVNHATETRMVFMFAGRVNMRASPRTGGAFFQRSVNPRGGRWERGWEGESDEWKEGGREGEEMPPPSNLPVSRRISQTRERNAKYWNTTPPDGHVVATDSSERNHAWSCHVIVRNGAPVPLIMLRINNV